MRQNLQEATPYFQTLKSKFSLFAVFLTHHQTDRKAGITTGKEEAGV